MLEASGLSAGYLGENVVEGVNVRVAAGQAVAVIDSNGAGKTTLFRALWSDGTEVGWIRGWR